MANAMWRRFALAIHTASSPLSKTSGASTVQPLTWSVISRIHRRQLTTSKVYQAGSTEGELRDREADAVSENDQVTPEFTNRNPRNLEKMALAYKDKGWLNSYPRRNYWHKLFVKRTARHVSAWVAHVNGHVAIEASTEEWAIKKHLYSTTDVVARRNLGRVIAQRCLEAGIEYMVCDLSDEELEAEGNKVFYEAVTEGGVTFEEPKSIGDFVAEQNYLPENY